MRKLLLMVVLAVASVTAMADDQLKIKTSAAEEPVSFAIDNIKEITFSAEGFTVVGTDDAETSYLFADLVEMTFDYATPQETGISRVGVSATSRIASDAVVYSLSGVRMLKDNLPAGVYVVKQGNQSFKFVKR